MKKGHILIAGILTIVIAGFFILQANSFIFMQWREGIEKVKTIDAFDDLDTEHRICIGYNEKGNPVMFQTSKNALGFWCMERMGTPIEVGQGGYQNFIWFTDKDGGELGSLTHEAIYGYGEAPSINYPDSVTVEKITWEDLYVVCLTAAHTDALGQVSIVP